MYMHICIHVHLYDQYQCFCWLSGGEGHIWSPLDALYSKIHTRHWRTYTPQINKLQLQSHLFTSKLTRLAASLNISPWHYIFLSSDTQTHSQSFLKAHYTTDWLPRVSLDLGCILLQRVKYFWNLLHTQKIRLPFSSYFPSSSFLLPGFVIFFFHSSHLP